MFAVQVAGGHGQVHPTLAQVVYGFHSEGSSRLVTLARLGAATKTSILVESGSMDFLGEPISVSANAEPLE
jgi:hypothetical protein